jgi:hypothetical protein
MYPLQPLWLRPGLGLIVLSTCHFEVFTVIILIRTLVFFINMDVDGDDEEDSLDSSDDDSIIIILSAASEALAEQGIKWHGVRMKWHLHVEMLTMKTCLIPCIA